jgi:hypothetical protein
MRKWYVGVAAVLLAISPPTARAGDPAGEDAPAALLDGHAEAPDPAAPVEDVGAGQAKAADNSCCFWASADALYWWTRQVRLPPLFTTGSATDAVPGAIGQPGTLPLSSDKADTQARWGGRANLGFWLDKEQTFGIEGGAFLLNDRSVNFAANPGPGAVLTRPFFNVNLMREDASILAFPGLATGSAAATVTTKFYGGDANFRVLALAGCCYNVAFLCGFRYLELSEQLQDATVSTTLPGFGGSSINASERFGDQNFFYGAQVGVDATFWWKNLSVDLTSKFAMGVTREIAQIDGSTTLQGFSGAVLTLPGGGFALPSILGGYGRNALAVAPEFGLNVGYALTCHCRITAGWSFLYLSNAFRPGELIDRTLNLSQGASPVGAGTVVGPLRPTFPGKDTDFWAQGANVGLHIRY